MATWIEPEMPPEADKESSLLDRLLWVRGLRGRAETAAFLDLAFYRGPIAEELPGVNQAIEVLLQAHQRGRRVFVWGDFDVDGQSATALLVGGFRRLGLDTGYYMPDRLHQGHGLNATGLQQIHQQGAELVVTCDCGVGDQEQLEIAHDLGLDVIVSDHHVMDQELKPLCALVHPHLLPPDHAFFELCGVGVAFMLLKGLHRALGGSFDITEYLDLVALGTVADRAVLLKENRYLVQCGMERLFYDPRPGIAALLRVAGVAPPEVLDTDLIGFTLAPRLNAVGRLMRADRAVELLLTEDMDQADLWAGELEQINRQRQVLCREAENEAAVLLAKRNGHPEVLVLASAKWHPGVLGIVATRLAKCYGCPALLIWMPEDGLARGSARSVPGLDIHRLLQAQTALLKRSGGHAMAAGFSLAAEDIPALETALIRAIGQQASVGTASTRDQSLPVQSLPVQSPQTQSVTLDAYVDLAEITPDLVRQVYRFAPFGAGNAKPILVSKQVRLTNKSKGRRHMRALVEDAAGRQQRAIWWDADPGDLPDGWVDVAFRIGLNDHWGTDQVQLELVDVRPVPSVSGNAVESEQVAFCQVEDWRDIPARQRRLEALCDQRGDAIQIWAEGDQAGCYQGGLHRDQLVQDKDLVVLSLPASAQIWATALRWTRPRTVYLVTGDTTALGSEMFVERLEQDAAKIASQDAGRITQTELAGRLGEREATVLAGLKYLVRAGRLNFREMRGELLIDIEKKPIRRAPKSGDIKLLLEETAAFRRYFSRALAEDLVSLSSVVPALGSDPSVW